MSGQKRISRAKALRDIAKLKPLKARKSSELSAPHGCALEERAALESWMREVTDLLCYQPEIPMTHKQCVVEAFSRYRTAIGRPLRP